MVQELAGMGDESRRANNRAIQEFGSLLTDAREHLVSIAKKEAPSAPDYATPVVKALNELLAEIKKVSSKEYSPKIDVKVPVVKVPKPEVKITTPKVDISGIEKVIKNNIPKAFESAIKLIPEPEKPDNSEILDKFNTMIEWLQSIDTASRLKPQPGSVKVSNLSEISFSPTLTERYDIQVPIVYVGTATAGTADNAPGWTITKYDINDLTNASGKVKLNGVWDDRTTEAYA